MVTLFGDRSFALRCSKCGVRTISVVVDRPVVLGTMADITEVKLNMIDDGPEISRLYAELSALLHPNNPGHQHDPKFDMKTLQYWLTALNRVLRLSLIFYSRGLGYIGYKDEETFSLLERRKYDLDNISLKELYLAICQKVGLEFNKRNPNYKYEDQSYNLPSYLEDK